MPLLQELLRVHNHRPRIASSLLRPAEGWSDETGAVALQADAVVAVLSARSLAAARITEELSTYRAGQPEATMAILLLDPLEIDGVLADLGRIEVIRIHEDFLKGFRRLFEILGNQFLSRDEVLDRRVEDSDRRASGDRRRTSTLDRLSSGLLLSYCRETGETGFERWDLEAKDPRELSAALTPEVRRYHFFDPVKGRALAPRDVLGRAVRLALAKSWSDTTPQGAQVLGFIAEEMCTRCLVTGIDRRLDDRRTG